MRPLFYTIFTIIAICIYSCVSNNDNINKELINNLLLKGDNFKKDSNIKEALICYWDALDLLKTQQDSLLGFKANISLGDMLFEFGVYEKAVLYHREGYNYAKILDDEKLMYEVTHKLGMDYLAINQKDSALYFFDLSKEIALSNNFMVKINPNEAVLGNRNDSILNIYNKEQLLNWETKYKRNKNELEVERQKNKELVRVVIYLIISILVLISGFIVYKIIKAEKEKREKEKQWFNKLLEENKAKLLSESSLKAITILNRIKENPCYMPINEEEFCVLKEFTETLFNGFSKGVEQNTELTQRDIELCYLTKLGVTTKQLAVFYGISPSSITKAKYRLQKKMSL